MHKTTKPGKPKYLTKTDAPQDILRTKKKKKDTVKSTRAEK